MSISFYSRSNSAVYDEECGSLLSGVPDCNFSNVNASVVMTELGMTFDYCGEILAKDLLTLINKWCAAHFEQDSTVEENYFRARIYRLQEMCELAVELNPEDVILWG